MTKETKGLISIVSIYFLVFVIPHFIPFSGGNQTLKILISLLVYTFLAFFGMYVLSNHLKGSFSWIKRHKLKSLGIVIFVFLAMTLFDIRYYRKSFDTISLFLVGYSPSDLKQRY